MNSWGHWAFPNLCPAARIGLLTVLCLWAQPCGAGSRIFLADNNVLDSERTLLAYAVNIHRTPVQNWPGYGIYLKDGLFLTAAHVVGRGWLTRPKVVISGTEYPTKIVKEGSFEGVDLTLLHVDEQLLPMRLRMRQMSICRDAPSPGERVVTIIPETAALTHVVAPDVIPASARKFRTAVADVAGTGNSGSGVFDSQRRCLLGIMSRKISQAGRRANGQQATRDIAKYFVPAADIESFLSNGSQ